MEWPDGAGALHVFLVGCGCAHDPIPLTDEWQLLGAGSWLAEVTSLENLETKLVIDLNMGSPSAR